MLIGACIVISYSGWWKTFTDIRSKYISFQQHRRNEGIAALLQPRLITAEWSFLIWSFVVSVALINALRPMPIGWDDLGVYMNYPKIMAQTGEYILGLGMYTWQLITGTGFLF